MSEEPIPIRAGVVPEMDIERELIDFCQTQIRRFRDGAKQPPTRIAVALMGKGENGNFHTRANSWDCREETSRIENCGIASALFLQRGIVDE